MVKSSRDNRIVYFTKAELIVLQDALRQYNLAEALDTAKRKINGALGFQ